MKNYNDLSPLTRVWIYQSNKGLNEQQVKTFHELAEVFQQNWESHGKPVNGTMQLFHNRFIVVFVDDKDEQSCGRSVDGSVRFMKELEQEMGVSLLDRMLVAFRNGNKIESCSMPEFEELIQAGKVNENTLVFNNTIHTMAEFNSAWEVPLSRSWHARLLAK
jgi:hypothetical protein